MIAVLCCVLDSRGAQHDDLVRTADEKAPGLDVIIWREGQALSTVERYNAAFNAVRSVKYSHYMFGASDIEIETPGFDRIIAGITDQLEYRLGHRCFILYPNDGVHGRRLCTHPIFTKEFLDATDEFFPAGYMRHCYVDNYIKEIGLATETLIYCPSLRIIHNHPIATKSQKAVLDEHYEKAYSEEYMNEDRRQYERCMKEHAVYIIKRIKKHKKHRGYSYDSSRILKLKEFVSSIRRLTKHKPRNG